MTEDEWYELIEKWEESGDTQKHFCKIHRVKYGEFKTWRTKGIANGRFTATYDTVSSQQTDHQTLFSPLEVSQPNIKSIQQHIEIHLPHGILLKLPIDSSC